MRRIRVIPSLLISEKKLVKTTQFKTPLYIGDPLNALRIFNEKGVDEIVILDIRASLSAQPPDLSYIKQLATECFMPMAYGGGIRSVAEAMSIFKVGVEKIIIGAAAHQNSTLVTDIVKEVGSQSVVISMDIKKNLFGKNRIIFLGRSQSSSILPTEFAKKMEGLGVGEILLQNIDHEGTLKGYDLNLIEAVSSAVTIPVIASGGAASIDDFFQAVKKGASAVAAGSMFVYRGSKQSVLINYPSQEELFNRLYNRI